MKTLCQNMKNCHIIDMYREAYKYAKAHPEDKAFADEYSPQILRYKTAVEEIFKHNKTLPGTESIYKKLEKLQYYKQEIMEEFQKIETLQDKLIQYKKNYDTYLRKEVEQ